MRSVSSGLIRRKHVFWLAIVGLFAVYGVSRSTPPHVPYHQFFLEGRIERADGGTLDQFTVAVVSVHGSDEHQPNGEDRRRHAGGRYHAVQKTRRNDNQNRYCGT